VAHITASMRVMLQTHWSAEAWSQVRVEFNRALALRSEIQRAGWFNSACLTTGDPDVTG
jgi:hypothetical protein